MLALLVAIVVSASGDPYILRYGEATQLDVSEDTELQALMASRFASVTYSAIDSVTCQSSDGVRPWECEVAYWATPSWATPSWATIRDSLLAQVTWVPGQGGAWNTWLVRVKKSFVASAAWRPLAQSLWPDLLASPMLLLSYKRIGGTGNFVGSIVYKRSMNLSGIATAVQAGETLVPDGVTP